LMPPTSTTTVFRRLETLISREIYHGGRAGPALVGGRALRHNRRP
jgi:hypothetical protein